MCNDRDRAGFTLLEVVMVITVTALAGVMAAMVIGSAQLKIFQAVTQEQELLDARNCMERVVAEFEAARRAGEDAQAALRALPLTCTNATVSLSTRTLVQDGKNNKELAVIKGSGEPVFTQVTVRSGKVEFKHVLGE